MNLQAILVTNGVGCAILVILLISSHLVRQRRTFADKIFTAMIFLTGEACITESATFFLDGKVFSGAEAVDMALNSILYLTNITTSFLWLEYTDLRLYHNIQRLRQTLPVRLIPLFLGTIGLILNLKFRFFFTINSEFIYFREPLGYIYYVITFLYLAASLILRQHYYNIYGKIRFFPIFTFLIPVIIGTAVQSAVYGVSLAWCSVSLGLVGIYMCLQNELSYIDPLTSLYNRNYMNAILQDILYRKLPAAGIMIDLDFFKSINDTFGHTTGDVALMEAASIINHATPDNSVSVRYAGDEFIVILYTNKKEMVEKVIERIRCGVDAFNKTGGHKYILSFSIGSYIFNSCDESIEIFLQRMDQAMYEEKKLKHKKPEAETETEKADEEDLPEEPADAAAEGQEEAAENTIVS